MTRRDYVRIAAVMRSARPMPPYDGGEHLTDYGRGAYSQWVTDVQAVSAMLAEGNPKYDAPRFMDACGATMAPEAVQR